MSREEPIKKRGTRAADVQITGGRWGETNTDRIHGNILTVDAVLENDEARMVRAGLALNDEAS